MVEIQNSVIKFGGTSVANERKNIISIVEENKPRYVVVSAPGKRTKNDIKVTDLLITLSNEWNPGVANEVISRYAKINDAHLNHLYFELEERCKNETTNREDEIISFGEYAAAKLLSGVLNMSFYDPKDFIRVKDKKYAEVFDLDKVPEFAIIPGFYGSNLEGKIETLSRGGSDLTGAIIANAFNLPYHNFTDSPIKVVDPRLIENPEEISEMTYRELRYLTLSGFSIIHQDVWHLMEEARLPLIVRSTSKYPQNGTYVSNERLLNPKNQLLEFPIKIIS